jgi:hypothetical protein
MDHEGRSPPPSTPLVLVVLAWVVVGTPLLWGILQTLKKAAALFS